MRRLARVIGYFTAVSGLLAGSAMAADMPTKAPAVSAISPPAYWLNTFGGLAVDESGWFADLGGVVAFNRNLDLPGWLLRVRGGGGHYEYNRTATLSQGVDYQVGEAMLGYQIFSGPTRLTLYAGGNVEHHDNPDPLATVAGTEFGFKAQGELFSSFAPNWYALLLANYSTAFQSYFVLGKLGYKVTNIVSVGPEAAALGNDRYDAVRAGGFVGIDITPTTMVILSGGYSWDQHADILNDHSGGYGTLHIRSLF
jgi:hypothetical protein